MYNKLIPISKLAKAISMFCVLFSFAQTPISSIKTPTFAPVLAQTQNGTPTFVEKEIVKLGLHPIVQQDFSLSRAGNLAMSTNIIAKINGKQNKNAILFIAHYKHLLGKTKSDEGVQIVLQSISQFLRNRKEVQQNPIIFLFVQEGELGVNGVRLFAFKHELAQHISLVINLHNKGVSDIGYLCNTPLASEFVAAGGNNSYYNSFIHSLNERTLPKETELTVFTEEKNTHGFNLALSETYSALPTASSDNNTPKNIAKVLPSVLGYFSNVNLAEINFTKHIYFTTLFGIVYYPADWSMIMFYISLVIFITLLIVGKVTLSLTLTEVIQGFAISFVLLITTVFITYFGWKLFTIIYPRYADFNGNGFYNSSYYIIAFSLFILSMCFAIYSLFVQKKLDINLNIAPLFLWLMLNLLFALFIHTASFFIIPYYFGLVAFGVRIITYKNYNWVNYTCGFLAFAILAPFVPMFTLSFLGMNAIVWSMVLVVLVFGLIFPALDTIKYKLLLSFALFFFAFVFFVVAHINSYYNNDKPKPNSLVYLYNADTNKAFWATYDENLDEWTDKYLGETPTNSVIDDISTEKNFPFTYLAEAPKKEVQKSTYFIAKDSIIDRKKPFRVAIYPTATANRIDVFADENMNIYSLIANDTHVYGEKHSYYMRQRNKVLTYFIYNNQPLELQFCIDQTFNLKMSFVESSSKLFAKNGFVSTKRDNWMVPKPNVVTDVVMTEQKLMPEVKNIAKTPVKFVRPVIIKRPEATKTPDSIAR